jgi:hypothetical protein
VTQPSFVPIAEVDQVRPALRLETPRAWVQDRPAELRFPVRSAGRHFGTPGPDQGYALRVAKRFEERLRLRGDESAEDVVVGAALLASRRAALFGRAPAVHDVETALSIFGFLDDDVPEGLAGVRREAFSGAAHDYDVQRDLVDLVPEEALRLRADEVRTEVASGRWETLVGG